MKKIVKVLLGSLLALSLCACNKNEAKTFEEALLKENTILVGISPDYPPFETLDSNGELIGFDVDMMNELIKIINKQQNTNLTVEFKQMDFNNIIGALQANQIDIGVSGFTYSPDRDCWFSTPYTNSKQVIITREDTGIKKAEDLAGKKVGAGLATTGADAVNEIEGAQLVQPGDYTVMFQALKAGQLDAIVCDEAVGDNYVSNMGFVKLDEALVDESMSIIANKTNELIQQVIDQAIEELVNSDTYQDILVKWELVSK
ncbi:MAG: transporter substrate-binding domain-containing protein [Traorella sp.]